MLAIIGGTGIYQLDAFDVLEVHHLDTPYGHAEVTECQFEGRKVFFLARHGSSHQLLPHEVNYRANIYGLKSLGITQVIGLSAVGSLQIEVKPGDLSIPDQYMDFVKGAREKTFFGNGIAAHVSTAEPTCRELADDIEKAAKKAGIELHRNKTYACVDGPRLGTKAESEFLRGPAGCDLVGMTNVPEVFLAREAQLAYCTITIATDYDCWQDDPSLHVTVDKVISRYGESLQKATQLLLAYLREPEIEYQCQCRSSLAGAILTPEQALSDEQKERLAVLKS
ncbi:5'-methylthioadenosine phosphorylase [Alteromonadaceae bacterium M269]|nr:5'-methylthioadenosine phosphorylase [Alteromonadaceae bacterium M269]